MPLTHQFVSAVSTVGTTATDVNADDWNDQHWSTLTNSVTAFPEVLLRSSAFITSNTSVAANIINYSIPARSLSSNRMVRWTGVADVLHGTTAVANNYQLEVRHGGSSRWKDTMTTIAAAETVTRALRMQIHVAATGTSGGRYLWGTLKGSSVAAGAFGLGDFGAVGANGWVQDVQLRSSATYTVTTGAAENITVAFNWVAANSSLSFRFRYGILELV